MENFLSVIIFTFPGLIAYFWIQLFGFTPTVRYQGTEIVAISAILWIPINICVLGLYYLITIIYKYNTYYPINLPLITDLKDLEELSSNLLFLLYYVVTSMVVSYLLARIVTGKLYTILLQQVNKVRIKNNKSPLSRDASVWDATFSKYIAQIVKIEYNGQVLIGEIENVSRTYESEKNIVLRYTDHWSEIMDNYDVIVDKVFIDTKTGLKIEVYNSDSCLKAESLYYKQCDESE